MTEVNLLCNYKNCRSLLSTVAWITSCSHVFCNEHAISGSGMNRKCPACNTMLHRKFDIVQNCLNPPEEYKSMVLAGLNPATIVDIAYRAIKLWNFQINQEKLYFMSLEQNLRTKHAQLELNFETMLVKLKNDLQVELHKNESLQKDIESNAKRIQDLEAIVADKNRQLETLQFEHDIFQRRRINSHHGASTLQHREMSLSPRYFNDVPMLNINAAIHNRPSTEQDPSGMSGFTFQPVFAETRCKYR